MIAQPTPLLLLDIDGTVRQGKDDPLGRFVADPEDVVVFLEAAEQMRRWRDRGGRIIGVSNQGGIALGLVDVQTVTSAMRETHLQTGGLFDLIAFCRHHPRAEDPEMSRCWCRKPRPGLAIEAALDMATRLHIRGIDEMYPPHLALFVGDRPEDQACAEALNIDFQWAAEWRAEVTR